MEKSLTLNSEFSSETKSTNQVVVPALRLCVGVCISAGKAHTYAYTHEVALRLLEKNNGRTQGANNWETYTV